MSGKPAHLLVPVALPDVHAGQVGHDERPQLLMRSELQETKHQQRSQTLNRSLLPLCINHSFGTWYFAGNKFSWPESPDFPSKDPHNNHNQVRSHTEQPQETELGGKNNLTLSAVVNCASALSMQFTEMQ